MPSLIKQYEQGMYAYLNKTICRICTPGCLNDGVCAEDKCICRDGFEGDHCEKEGRISISLQKPIFQTIYFLYFYFKSFF